MENQILKESVNDIKDNPECTDFDKVNPEMDESNGYLSKPLGRLPCWFPKNIDKHNYSQIRRMNRFLEYQEKMLFELIRKGEMAKASTR